MQRGGRGREGRVGGRGLCFFMGGLATCLPFSFISKLSRRYVAGLCLKAVLRYGLGTAVPIFEKGNTMGGGGGAGVI